MIGIDLTFIPEFQRQIELGGDHFIARAFHADERSSHTDEQLADAWTAKEAVMKAASVVPSSMLDVSVVRDPDGRLSARVGLERFNVWISHHSGHVVAVAQRVEP